MKVTRPETPEEAHERKVREIQAAYGNMPRARIIRALATAMEGGQELAVSEQKLGSLLILAAIGFGDRIGERVIGDRCPACDGTMVEVQTGGIRERNKATCRCGWVGVETDLKPGESPKEYRLVLRPEWIEELQKGGWTMTHEVTLEGQAMVKAIKKQPGTLDVQASESIAKVDREPGVVLPFRRPT